MEKVNSFDWTHTIKTCIFLLKIAGLWPESKRGYKMNLYAVYTFVAVNVVINIHVIFQTINIIFVYSNLEDLTETIFLCVAEMLAAIKIYIFVKNISILKQLIVTLNKDEFQPKNSLQINLVRPALNVWKKIYNTLLSAVFPAAVLYSISPFLNGSFKKYNLPFSVWYPYNYRAPLLYTLTYLHQILASFLIAIGDYNIDMLISALMMYVGAQCDILCDNLKNIGKNDNDVNKTVIKSIQHHKAILKFAKNCNDFFNFMMLGQFFTSCVCTAMALFRLALVTPSKVEFYVMICSTASMILQIFTYCWFGNEVEVKSNKIPYAIFECDWIPQPSSIKKSLIILTIRTMNPIRLSTFKIFYLSLSTYMSILRTAVSYFTILRQLNSPK